ncbi:MAG: MG2 domain-containing protein, partial [Enterobacteriaceae bacterium]
MLTDLGIIAKRSLDESHDLFIQSISTGEPVNGARVSVVARNGSTLLTQFSDASGHVRFPALDHFRYEKKPVMFLVQNGDDVSFLPIIKNYERYLNLSRFAVDGESEPRDPRSLSSYLFSDRGVYRPGDTFHIGTITRANDWLTRLNGIPLMAEIRDARNTLMSRQPLVLDKSGFNELSYRVGDNAPTGEWFVYLYLSDKEKKDNNDTLLGYTSVQVKEFEPDSMKAKVILQPLVPAGWVKPQDLTARVQAQNLFGTPAQGRRVSSKLILRPGRLHFDAFPDYLFYEEQKEREAFESDLEEQTTDQQGEATLPLDLSAYDNATYQLQLLTEVFEPGSGRSVAATAQQLVSPHDYLVGVKADGNLDFINKDAVRNLQIIAVDPKLQKMAPSALTL